MRNTIKAAAVLLLLAGLPARAAPLTPGDARTIADKVIALIGQNYVFPDKRPGIVAALKAKEDAGRYDVSNPAELVERLGGDMSEAGHDRHLWMKFDPAQNQALRAPPHGGGGGDYFERQAVLRNSGYEALRILPGNVRYVNLTGFIWGANTGRVVADVARFLADGDAVIIDLRQNGGGSPRAVQALVSYFLPPDNRVLMMFHQGANGAGRPTRVLSHLDAPRLLGKPLYVLTSDHTGSAAEEFAYHVEQFHLGTLVGQATGGAANNNTVYPVGDDYLVSVSTDRPEHPVSHSNWEGAGVPPDVAVPSDQALDTAHLLALKLLAAKPGAKDGSLVWAMDALQARLHPFVPDALAAYAGTYGERTIKLENGILVFQRAGREPTTLIPMAADLFAFANTEDIRARFRRVDGKVTGFDMITSDGQVIAVERS